MMTVQDVIEEFTEQPFLVDDYVLRVNVGDETSGDIYVDIDEFMWDHENRVVKINAEGAGV